MIYGTKHQMDQAMTLLDNAQIMPECKKAIKEFLTDLSVSGIEDLIDRLEDKVRHGWLLVFGSSQTITDLGAESTLQALRQVPTSAYSCSPPAYGEEGVARGRKNSVCPFGAGIQANSQTP